MIAEIARLRAGLEEREIERDERFSVCLFRERLERFRVARHVASRTCIGGSLFVALPRRRIQIECCEGCVERFRRARQRVRQYLGARKEQRRPLGGVPRLGGSRLEHSNDEVVPTVRAERTRQLLGFPRALARCLERRFDELGLSFGFVLLLRDRGELDQHFGAADRHLERASRLLGERRRRVRLLRALRANHEEKRAEGALRTEELAFPERQRRKHVEDAGVRLIDLRCCVELGHRLRAIAERDVHFRELEVDERAFLGPTRPVLVEQCLQDIASCVEAAVAAERVAQEQARHEIGLVEIEELLEQRDRALGLMELRREDRRRLLEASEARLRIRRRFGFAREERCERLEHAERAIGDAQSSSKLGARGRPVAPFEPRERTLPFARRFVGGREA